MIFTHQKRVGTQYSVTVALLAAAFIFSPAILILSRPIGSASVLTALAGSTSCILLAWFNWKKYSSLTVPSLETPRAEPE